MCREPGRVAAVEEMEILGIRPESQGNVPVVLLRERNGRHRHLPIFIGAPEAVAIQIAIERVDTPRPMTHDLLRDILNTLGAAPVRIVITDLADGVFFAEIHLRSGDTDHVVSSRPSDAIALAVRMDIPVFCVPAVLEAAAVVLDEPAGEGEEVREEVVEEFRQFIESVRPEDFEG